MLEVHLHGSPRNELLNLLQKIEDFFDGTLGTLKNISGKYLIKREYEADMFKTISSTQGTRRYTKKMF